MIRFSPRSEFPSGVNPIGVSPVGQRGGRSLPERLPAASIGSAQAGVLMPPKAVVPRTFSGGANMQARNSASSLARIASGSSLERGKFSQALFDVAFVVSAFVFVGATAAALLGSVFILFFVNL